ncbi:protein SMALL AUXIN UP-REGULATED RNA 10-like [Cryptomeria japonica]|uniref:protein SMALL AUXIN UP-REGULATED RNA 10-like n=1 Tax=Cryptomeria japonica TaxID=3369 RepID=UPI0025AD5BE5|nr:protein SMALL AUXIN UP-REGULATED RNA 10-like [Cryptomeria japonica]
MARRKGNPQSLDCEIYNQSPLQVREIPKVLIVKYIIRVLCRFAKAYKVVGHVLSSKSTRYFSFGDEFIGKSCSSLPTDVPKGHCAVYVGSERSRFIIPTKYLNHSLFRELLAKAEEEYGFDHKMGLTIPCEEVAFQLLTSMLEKKELRFRNMELNKLIDFCSSRG